MSTLAQQLQVLQAQAPSAGHTARSSRPSLLFDARAASDVDLQSLYDIGCSGLEELCQLQPRFISFRDSLFGRAALGANRDQQTRDVVEKLDERVEEFCLLLSEYFLQPSAFKALEYLIRRFRINEHNVNALMVAALPYHATNEFVRLVQTLAVARSTWSWLVRMQTSGAALPRETLVQRCINDKAVLQFICAAAKTLGARDAPPSRTYLSFYAVLLCEVAASATVDETLLGALVAHLVDGLGAEACADYRAATMMAIAELASRVPLGEPFLKVVATAMLKHMDSTPEHISTAILLFAHLAATQPHWNSLPRKALQLLLQLPGLHEHLASLASRHVKLQPLLRLLAASLVDVLSTAADADAAEGSGSAAAKTAVQRAHDALLQLVEGGLLAEVAEALARRMLRTARELPAGGHARSLLQHGLRALEQRHPQQVDAAVNGLLQRLQHGGAAPSPSIQDDSDADAADEAGLTDADKMDAAATGVARKQLESEMFDLIRETFVASAAAPLEAGGGTLNAALSSPQAQVRRLALQTLDEQLTAAGTRASAEARAHLHNHALTALADSELEVVLTALSLVSLPSVPASALVDALLPLLRRCGAMLHGDVRHANAKSARQAACRALALLADAASKSPQHQPAALLQLLQFAAPSRWEPRSSRGALDAASALSSRSPLAAALSSVPASQLASTAAGGATATDSAQQSAQPTSTVKGKGRKAMVKTEHVAAAAAASVGGGRGKRKAATAAEEAVVDTAQADGHVVGDTSAASNASSVGKTSARAAKRADALLLARACVRALASALTSNAAAVQEAAHLLDITLQSAGSLPSTTATSASMVEDGPDGDSEQAQHAMLRARHLLACALHLATAELILESSSQSGSAVATPPLHALQAVATQHAYAALCAHSVSLSGLGGRGWQRLLCDEVEPASGQPTETSALVSGSCSSLPAAHAALLAQLLQDGLTAGATPVPLGEGQSALSRQQVQACFAALAALTPGTAVLQHLRALVKSCVPGVQVSDFLAELYASRADAAAAVAAAASAAAACGWPIAALSTTDVVAAVQCAALHVQGLLLSSPTTTSSPADALLPAARRRTAACQPGTSQHTGVAGPLTDVPVWLPHTLAALQSRDRSVRTAAVQMLHALQPLLPGQSTISKAAKAASSDGSLSAAAGSAVVQALLQHELAIVADADAAAILLRGASGSTAAAGSATDAEAQPAAVSSTPSRRARTAAHETPAPAPYGAVQLQQRLHLVLNVPPDVLSQLHNYLAAQLPVLGGTPAGASTALATLACLLEPSGQTDGSTTVRFEGSNADLLLPHALQLLQQLLSAALPSRSISAGTAMGAAPLFTAEQAALTAHLVRLLTPSVVPAAGLPLLILYSAALSPPILGHASAMQPSLISAEADGSSTSKYEFHAAAAALAPIHLAALQVMSADMYQVMGPALQPVVLRALLASASSSLDAACKAAAQVALSHVALSAEALAPLLQLQPVQPQPAPVVDAAAVPATPSKRQKRGKKDQIAPTAPAAAPLEAASAAGLSELDVIISVLELLQTRAEEVTGQQELVAELHALLEALLPSVGSILVAHREDITAENLEPGFAAPGAAGSGTITQQAGQEPAAADDDDRLAASTASARSSLCGYAAQLLLSVLDRVISHCSAADGVDTSRDVSNPYASDPAPASARQRGRKAGAAAVAISGGTSPALPGAGADVHPVLRQCDMGLIVRLAQAAPDAAVRNAALGLVSTLAMLMPAQALEHVLQVLTLVHTSSALSEDEHSQAVAGCALSAIVPVWLCGGKPVEELWQALIDALPSLSPPRRLPLLVALLQALPQDPPPLSTALLLLLRAAVAELSTPAVVGVEDGNPTPAEWLPELASQLAMQIPRAQRLNALPLLLEAALEESNMQPTAALPRAAVACATAQLQTMAVPSNTLPSTSITSSATSDRAACSALMSVVVRQMQLLQPSDAGAAAGPRAGSKKAARASKASREALYALLSALQGVMPSVDYLLALADLGSQSAERMRRRALKLYSDKLRRLAPEVAVLMRTGGGAAAARARELQLAALSSAAFAISPLLPQLLLPSAGAADATAAANAPTTAPSAITRQYALVALHAAAELFGSISPAPLLAALPAVLSTAAADPNAAVRGSALAAVAASVRALGARLVPLLPATINGVVAAANAAWMRLAAPAARGDNNASAATAAANDGIDADKIVEQQDDGAGPAETEQQEQEDAAAELSASLAALLALVESVGPFLSPHLPVLLQLLLQPRVLGCETGGCASFAASVRRRLPGALPPRLLLPAIYGQFVMATAGGLPSFIALMDLAGSTAVAMDSKMAAAHADGLFTFLLRALDLRQCRPGSFAPTASSTVSAPAATTAIDGDIAAAEAAAINALVALIMKLSEAKFKPLFLRLHQWATSLALPIGPDGAVLRSAALGEDARNSGGLPSNVGRVATLFGAAAALTDRLRSVFVPYFRYLMDLSVLQLSGSADGLRAAPRSAKKSKKAAAEAAVAHAQVADASGAAAAAAAAALEIEDSWVARVRVVAALQRCFTHDRSGFLEPERFARLLQPLAAQLDAEPPAAAAAAVSRESAAALRTAGVSTRVVGGSSTDRTTDSWGALVASALAAMAVASGSDVQWKPLNHAVLMFSRRPSPRTRALCLSVVKEMVERLREEYLVLLPETLPFVAELLEDMDPTVEAGAQELMQALEEVSGEKLDQYLK